MKKKIAVNSKYFSKTQAKALLAHAKREFANDKNVINPRLTKHNFGTKDRILDARYEESVEAMPKSVKNSLIDSVLVLPIDQLREVRKSNPEGWKGELSVRIKRAAEAMSKELGFDFLGYKVHLDEGKKREDGKIVLNPHVHLYFANICTREITLKKTKNLTKKGLDGKALRDPKNAKKYQYERDKFGKILTEEVEVNLKGRAPLSLHQTRGKNSVWSRQQDIAAEHLKDLGFERGESKEITNAKHLNKTQFVAEQLSKQEQKIEANKTVLSSLQSMIKSLEELVSNVVRERESALKLALKGGLSRSGLDGLNAAVSALKSPATEQVCEESIERVNDASESFEHSAETADQVAQIAELFNAKLKKEKAAKEAASTKRDKRTLTS